MSTDYVTLVNNAIQEAGCDLASFASDGSDFNSTGVDPLMKRFKTWTNRAWRDIQQEAMDWEFMHEQGLVNIDPGIMFFGDGTVSASTYPISFANSTQDIYDQDGTIAVNDVVFDDGLDLTGTETASKSLFYLNIVGDPTAKDANNFRVDFALKPSAEYITGRTYFADGSSILVGGLPVTSGAWDFEYTLPGGSPVTIENAITSVVWDSGTAQLTFVFSRADIAEMIRGTITTTSMYIRNEGHTKSFTVDTSFDVINLSPFKAYVHSWKSFDFSEEDGDRDFKEEIQEINQQSFRLIDFYNLPPQSERHLDFVPWEIFRDKYDISGTVPGTPRMITEDDMGRYRLYPHPDRTYSLKFEYIRNPQTLSSFSDVPRNLDDDFVDLIMWRAVMYYGEYDEQPTVVARAYKNYKQLLQRFEMLFREKVHFKPARLY